MRRLGRGADRAGGESGEVRPRLHRQQVLAVRRRRHPGARLGLVLALLLALAASRGTPARAAPAPIDVILNRDQLYDIASDAENRKYPELRAAVLKANPELSAFDIVRAGDDVTLAFGLRRNGIRADFRLFGNKHDYYRMAMGVRVEETFQILAEADPNIDPAGIRQKDRDITLSLRYAWPAEALGALEAAPVPAVVPAPVAAPPPAAAEPEPAPPRPSRRERPLQPPPEAEPERNPKYFVPARSFPGEDAAKPPAVAESPVAPPPLAVPPAPSPAPPRGPRGETAETRAEAEEQARVPPSEIAAQASAVPHPAEEARPAPELRPEAHEAGGAAEQAPSAPTKAATPAATKPPSFEPAGVEAEVATLGPEEQPLELVPVVESEVLPPPGPTHEEVGVTQDDDQRRKALEAARHLANATAYRMFLAAYPDAPEAGEIWKLLKAAEADDAAFAASTGSVEGLEAYVAMYPKGQHADDARQRLAALRNVSAEAAFRVAQDEATAEAFQAFLKAWPKSPRAPEARAALDAIRKQRFPQAGKQPELTLVAAYSPSAPVLNGRDNDPGWQGAQAVEIPLNGGPGAKSLRLKAFHDGRSLFLLAQWNDDGRDTQYRPWLWDAGKKSYKQGGQVDDALAVALYRGKPPADGCMLRGEPQDADIWIWRAQWAELSGLADDQSIRVSTERAPKANPYPSQSGQGQVWIRQDADGGAPGWSFSIPVEYQGAVLPSYRKSEATGSRKDVRAAGLWGGGAWTVELARALDTKNPDDVALRERGAVGVSFAVYNKAEKARHATSGVVRLELRGR